MTTQAKNTAPVTKKEEQKQPAKVVAIVQTPVEETLQKINSLIELKSRYARIIDSQKKLNDFKTEKGDEQITLSLEDENNHLVQFVTSNPEVIREVVKCLSDTINSKKSIIESELLKAAA